jgi:putative copper resistance protein D
MTAVPSSAVPVKILKPGPALLVPGVVLASIVVVLAGVGTDTSAGSAAAGLAEAGPLTRVLLALSRALVDLGLVGVVGTLVAAGWLLDTDQAVARTHLLRASARWSAALAVTALLQFVAATSLAVGVPLRELAFSPGLLATGIDVPQGRALLLLAVGATAVLIWSSAVGTALGARVLTGLVLTAVTPLLVSGHAATSSSHLLTSEALVVHVLAASAWMGGLLALVVHLRPQAELLPASAHRFSRLAGLCFAAVALSGLVGAWTRLGTDLASWQSRYGVLLVLKVGCLVVLGLIGARHRTHTLRGVIAGRPRAFVRLASAEVVLMGLAVGLAVVLSRTAPPARAALRAAPVHASGYATVDRSLPPLDVWHLLARPRSDALLFTLTVAVLVVALLALRTWSRRQPAWPLLRRAALVGAVVATGWALVGGLGSYATALLSAQVLQLAVLTLVVPVLLAVGLPASWPQPRLWDVVGRHRDAPLALTVLLTATFETPLLGTALHSVAGHTALAVAFLVVGTATILPVLRPDLAGRGSSSPCPALLLLPAVACAWLAWNVHQTGREYAGGWFSNLAWWWSDLVSDQHAAAVVLAVLACGLGAVALVRPRRAGDVPGADGADGPSATGADRIA